ncbi:MAG: urea carboxylase-associated family protein [Sphingomonas bacterium]
MTPGVQVIPERSGAAFPLPRGATLTVIDPRGEQVADLLAFNAADVDEVISSGRTLDYAETIRLTTGHRLYSNRSRVMLTIIDDSVGCHDFLLTPCSVDTFLHFYPDLPPHRGCFGNLAEALHPYGIGPDRIPIAFNCFMNVPVDGDSGRLRVLPPISKAGDHIVFRAEMDLVIGLTACSAPDSNGGTFKPIHYRIDAPAA